LIDPAGAISLAWSGCASERSRAHPRGIGNGEVHVKAEVRRLGVADREEAVGVLSAAFHDYPVMRYVLKDSGEAYDEHFRELIGFFCDKRLTRGWPVFGVRSAGRLVAVAGVNDPGDDSWPDALHGSWDRLRSRIGAAAIDRLNAYDEESARDEPPGPHHFLGIIGVVSGQQGQGYGAALLGALSEHADADARSAGVCLNTELSGNVPFYRRHGYEVIAERDIGDIHTWCMFRPASR
jgi:GNAT superfamily N-acetyltransferase